MSFGRVLQNEFRKRVGEAMNRVYKTELWKRGYWLRGKVRTITSGYKEIYPYIPIPIFGVDTKLTPLEVECFKKIFGTYFWVLHIDDWQKSVNRIYEHISDEGSQRSFDPDTERTKAIERAHKAIITFCEEEMVGIDFMRDKHPRHICACCGRTIDADICWCGIPKGKEVFHSHNIVSLGCLGEVRKYER